MKRVISGGSASVRFLVLLLLLSSPARAQNREDGKERAAMQRAYVAQRADASGEIPAGALYRGWQEVTAMPNASNGALADASWRSLGPAGLFINQESFGGVYGGEMKSGRVNSIAFHPTDSRTLLLGSQGGVWRTTTGATTWTPLTDQQCTSSIGAVVIDPINPSIIYAGTGDGRSFVQAGCGVLRSTDGGNTWTPPQTTTLLDAYTFHMAIDKRTAGSNLSTTVLAATNRGVYASVNSGAGWSQRIAGFATSVIADATRPGVFFPQSCRETRILAPPCGGRWTAESRGQRCRLPSRAAQRSRVWNSPRRLRRRIWSSHLSEICRLASTWASSGGTMRDSSGRASRQPV